MTVGYHNKIFDNVSQEVQRGIKLLDQKLPGWHNKINLEKLDMNDFENCILGQLFNGEYIDAVTSVVPDRDTCFYGFESEEESYEENMSILQYEWTEYIVYRQSSDRNCT